MTVATILQIMFVRVVIMVALVALRSILVDLGKEIATLTMSVRGNLGVGETIVWRVSEE